MGGWRRIESRIWLHDRFKSLTAAPPNGQTLILYLLTNPNTGAIPGLYRAGEAQLAEELGWPLDAPEGLGEGFREGFPKGFREAWAEASGKGWVEASWKDRLVWIPKAIFHDLPASPNVVLSWAKIAENELPECPLKWRALMQIRQVVLALRPGREAYRKAFDEAFGKGFRKGFPEGFADALPEPRVQIPESRFQSNPPPKSSSEQNIAQPSLTLVLEEEGLGTASKDAAQNAAVGQGEAEEVAAVPGQPPPCRQAFWGEIQQARKSKGLAPEERRPRRLTEEWFQVKLATYGWDAMLQAVWLFLECEDFAPSGWPTAVMLTEEVFNQRCEARRKRFLPKGVV